MTTPAALAAGLGVSPRRLRAWLRREWPEPRGARWLLGPERVARAGQQFGGSAAVSARPRGDSDEVTFVPVTTDAQIELPWVATASNRMGQTTGVFHIDVIEDSRWGFG